MCLNGEFSQYLLHCLEASDGIGLETNISMCHVEEVGIGGRLILKWILWMWAGRAWTGFI
jgi:hypothetical protein